MPDTAPLGASTVEAVAPTASPLRPGATSQTLPMTNLTQQSFWAVKVTSWPLGWTRLAFDCLLAPRNELGSSFVVRNNIIANNRGRGILLKASHGTVADNWVHGPKFWGMQVCAPQCMMLRVNTDGEWDNCGTTCEGSPADFKSKPAQVQMHQCVDLA